MSKDYHFNDLAFIQIILDDYGKKNIFYQKYKDHQRVCIWKDQKYYVYVEPVGIMELNLVIAEYEVQQKGLFKKRDVYFNKNVLFYCTFLSSMGMTDDPSFPNKKITHYELLDHSEYLSFKKQFKSLKRKATKESVIIRERVS